MAAISHEIGLEDALAKLGVGRGHSDKTLTQPSPDHSGGEKAIVEREENEVDYYSVTSFGFLIASFLHNDSYVSGS